METRLANRTRLFTFVVAAVFTAWSLYYVYRTSLDYGGQRVFLLWDDAMVSMRYAKNFAEGHGLTWNANGERVQGFSNPLVTFVMVGMHLLPIAADHVSVVFQLMNVGFLLLTAWLARDLALAISDENQFVGNLAGLATLLNASLAILSIQGTDVGASAVLLVAALRWAVRGAKGPRATIPLATFLFLGANILVRPDGIVPLVVVAAFAFRFEKKPRPLVVGAVVGALTLGGLFAFGQLYYGDPLPNTYYLKATGCPRSATLASGVGQTLASVRGMVFPLAITVVGCVAFHRKDPWVRLLAATAAAIALYNAWVGGDWVWEYTSRFLAPALPILVVLFELAVWSVVQRVGIVGDDEKVQRLSPSRRADLFVLVSVLASTTFSTSKALVEWLNPAQPTMYYADNLENYQVGRYLKKRTDPDTTVALRWAGTVAYFSERPGLDVLGKSDRHIAHLVVDRFEPGHSKWDWDYVVNTKKPDIVQGDDRGLGDREDFRKLYRGVTKPPRTEPYFFLRTEAASKLHDPDAKLLDPK